GQAFSFSNDFDVIGPIDADTIIVLSGKTTNAGYFGGEIDYIVTSETSNSSIGILDHSFFFGGQTSGNIQYIWDGVDDDSLGLSFSNKVDALGNCEDFSIAFSESSFS